MTAMRASSEWQPAQMHSQNRALSLCYAALGYIDGHVQNTVAVWDMAAGLAICSEAGLACRFGGEGPKRMWVIADTERLIADIEEIRLR